MSRLLSNLPIEDLTPENDYLGIIEKAELIKSFLIANKDEFSQIKMFSLYGNWGSGKSTLMKFLQKELQGDFNTFFFESWEYERDENLAFSLQEFISRESEILSDDVSKEFISDFLKLGGKLLRGVGKSVKLSIPVSPGGPKIEIAPSSLVEEFTSEENSFYQNKLKFKKEFKRWEDYVTRGEEPKFNIIFIDDLDRCEPENVLNLLSAIKLFFSFGDKTIFFCGIDKKAVREAVQTRYSDVVKSNEYLEKVFDISFEMPINNDLTKFLNYYFNDFELELGGKKISFIVLLREFFEELKMDNPRKIKKILNKSQPSERV